MNIKTVLSNNYVLFEKLGSGSFGEVFRAKHKSGRDVAIKVEENKQNRVVNEYKIYSYLHRKNFNKGLPKVYDIINTSDYNMMSMQLLGSSLEDLFNIYNRKFNYATLFKMAEQIISLLEQLHRTKFIHRDIKPNNFLIGLGVESNQIYIMDFGLSKKYINNNKHINYTENRSLIGTARYASIKMHIGIEPSRRDDLESVSYMLVYFAKGTLPWQGIKKKKRNKSDLIELIGESKMCTSLEDLCLGLPPCFKNYIKYCRNLRFDENPNYEYCRKLFSDEAKKMDITPKFCWT